MVGSSGVLISLIRWFNCFRWDISFIIVESCFEFAMTMLGITHFKITHDISIFVLDSSDIISLIFWIYFMLILNGIID